MQLCAINQRPYAGQDPAEDSPKEAAPEGTRGCFFYYFEN